VNEYDKSTKDNGLWDRIEHEQVTDVDLLDWIWVQEHPEMY